MLTIYGAKRACSSLAIPISNAVLLKRLRNFVPRKEPGVSVDAVITAGALDVHTLTSSPLILQRLREALARSVGWVNILLTSVIFISIPAALGMQWLNRVEGPGSGTEVGKD